MAGLEARVDTVGVAFPIAAVDDVGAMVRAGWTVNELVAVKGKDGVVAAGDGLYGTGGVRARYSRHLDGGGFLAVGKGEMAWVEASLPKRRGQWESLGVGDALAEIEAMVGEARQFVSPTRARAVPHTGGDRAGHVVSVDDPKVIRLDLVREFALREPELLSPLLDGLAAVHHPGRTKVQRFADGGRGRAETLRIGPKAWGQTLYDKHAESATWASDPELRMAPAPPGSLRCETRLHGDQLLGRRAAAAGGQVGRVSDLAEHKLRQLRRAWWDLTGCGRQVTASSALAALVMGRDDWSHTLRFSLLGWLEHPEWGFASRNTEAKCRRLAAELGVVRGRDLDLTVRLDYDAGSEVATLATAA